MCPVDNKEFLANKLATHRFIILTTILYKRVTCVMILNTFLTLNETVLLYHAYRCINKKNYHRHLVQV
jgi:hypothetical protein